MGKMRPEKIFGLKRLKSEAVLFQQQLEKVTQSNLCLICGITVENEIVIRDHFRNVHFRGEFRCKTVGCDHVAKTNGDLKMHCLISHKDSISIDESLPGNSRESAIVSHEEKANIENEQPNDNEHSPNNEQKPQKNTQNQSNNGQKPRKNKQNQRNNERKPRKYKKKSPKKEKKPRQYKKKLPKTESKVQNKKQPKSKKQTEEIVIPIMENPLIKAINGDTPKCSTCALPFVSEIGINLHQRYHRFKLYLPKIEKMSDIETVDELETIIEVNDEDKLTNRRLSTNVNSSIASTVDEGQEPRQLDALNERLLDLDAMLNAEEEIPALPPQSPTGSIISISSTDSTQEIHWVIDEVDYVNIES